MYTVKDFLGAEIVPWYRILFGHDLIESNFIEHASALELPIENFARKNELALSTIVGCENEEAFLTLVRDLYTAEASALLVTRPEDTVTLPQKVLDYLGSHPFPVILIPWHIRFADIIDAVSKQIQKDSNVQITQYETIQKRLLETYLSNQNMNCAAQLLADSFQSQILIFDTSGRCKGFSKNFAAKEVSELEQLFFEKNYIIDIKAHERLYGSLYLKPLTSKKLYDESLFFHYLIWPLVLWFDKDWVIQAANQSTKDDFIWRLTKGPLESFEKMCEEGQRLGFYLRGSYTCIVGDIYFYNSSNTRADEQWIAPNINLLKEEILQTAHAIRRRVMVTYQKNLLIIYLQSTDDYFQHGIDLFLDKLEKKAGEVFPQIRFTWGISGPGGDPTDFRKCFQDAKLAQELCVNTSAKNSRFTFKNTVVYNIISFLATDSAIHENVKNIIAPLLEYDAATGSSLLETLQCYLDCKNLSEAARLLHLHRQSLLYRINKIEELTGLSLKNADNFFLLEICVRLYTSRHK